MSIAEYIAVITALIIAVINMYHASIWNARSIVLVAAFLLYRLFANEANRRQWAKQIRILFLPIVGFLALIIILYLPPIQKELDGSKVSVSILNAVDFDGYRGATEQTDAKIIDKNIQLSKKFVSDEFIPFIFGIANTNDRIPLQEPLLIIEFIDEIGEVQSAGWQTVSNKKQYNLKFNGSISNVWTYGSRLSVKFPQTGTYKIRSTIDGLGIKPIETDFEVILY